MPAPNEITVPQLLRLIGTPDCPVLIDVSIDADFAYDSKFVPGALRHPHTDIAGLIGRLGGRESVVICQKGAKLSQGVSAQLRCAGLRSEYLGGGNHGWRAHPKAPRVPADAIPDKVDGRTMWVTRHRPKIDRIACPWLIRRFVDRRADFLFVSPGDVVGVAERFGATPFDVEDLFWSHRDTGCTFDTMLDVFEIRTPPLDRMAGIIRAADTNRCADVAEAAGLLAFSVGLSRQFKDDLQQLEAGLTFYDALYRWARDGQGESHDWPGVTP